LREKKQQNRSERPRLSLEDFYEGIEHAGVISGTAADATQL
jgi:hypothetical protein